MRRVSIIFALGALATLGSASDGLGTPPHTGCPVGPRDTGTATIGAWEAWDQPTLADAMDAAGGNPADAAATFAFNDRNEDGLLCVMTQVLPNDASGFTTFFVPRDNNAAAG